MAEPYRATFTQARGRFVHGIGLTAFLLLCGLWFLLIDPDGFAGALWIGVVMVVVALGFGALTLRRARNREAQLIIDENGVWYQDWGLPSVPWSEIGEVYQKGSKIQAFVALQLSDGNHLIHRLSDEERRKVNMGRLVRPGLLLIPNGALEGTLKDVETAILEGKTAHRR